MCIWLYLSAKIVTLWRSAIEKSLAVKEKYDYGRRFFVVRKYVFERVYTTLVECGKYGVGVQNEWVRAAHILNIGLSFRTRCERQKKKGNNTSSRG